MKKVRGSICMGTCTVPSWTLCINLIAIIFISSEAPEAPTRRKRSAIGSAGSEMLDIGIDDEEGNKSQGKIDEEEEQHMEL